ncbi:MAG: acyl carrier protein [Gammaproteobacteria bacterium]|nr:acyl carrier protein [Gammaproteobacteria bacterium]MCF6362461.1 acyl carrier protein [Gammaproteobacteria bacterium]
MHTKESIYEHLKNIMVELFEIEADTISLDARLYEELDIDSIDAVDMIIKLKDLTGKKMQPADFKNVRTVQDVVDAVYALVNNDTPKQ